jgi:hypothetical protein
VVFPERLLWALPMQISEQNIKALEKGRARFCFLSKNTMNIEQEDNTTRCDRMLQYDNVAHYDTVEASGEITSHRKITRLMEDTGI